MAVAVSAVGLLVVNQLAAELVTPSLFGLFARYHWLCYRLMGQLQRGECNWSGRQLRALNELPTFLVIVVLLVVFKQQFPTVPPPGSWLGGVHGASFSSMPVGAVFALSGRLPCRLITPLRSVLSSVDPVSCPTRLNFLPTSAATAALAPQIAEQAAEIGRRHGDRSPYDAWEPMQLGFMN